MLMPDRGEERKTAVLDDGQDQRGARGLRATSHVVTRDEDRDGDQPVRVRETPPPRR